MADRVQAYNQPSAPWLASHPEGTAEGHPTDLDRRHPHRAATSPAPSTTSSLMNPYIGQAAYQASLYPGQRPPQTVHRSDVYFSPNMNYTRYDPLYPAYPSQQSVPNAAQFYPAHQQQFYGVQYQQQYNVRTPSPQPPVPIPAKPPALQQEARQDGRHGPLHPTMYRSFTSPPPVPPKPSLLFEPEAAAIPTSAYLGSSSSARPLTAGMGTTAATTTPPVPPLPPGALAAGPSANEASTSQSHEQRDDDGDELAVALALSKDQSMREEERMKELARLEEEEFERALAASMLTAKGGYDFYDSQPGAGPSNWASSLTQSSSAVPTDTLQEAGPSSSSPSSSPPQGTSKDVLPVLPSPPEPESAGEPKADASVSQAPETGPAGERAIVSSPRSTKRRSLDTPAPNGTTSPNLEDVLPTYSQEVNDRMPTSSTLPSNSSQPDPGAPTKETPKDEDKDSEDDALPYLRGVREDLTLSIPAESSAETRRTRLSPVSASFMDLSYDDSYIGEDEALARRLAEEEEQAAQQESQRGSQTSTESYPYGTNAANTASPEAESNLPTYNDAISSAGPASRRSTLVPEVRVNSPATPAQNEKMELARNRSINSVASDPVPSSSLQPTVPFPSDGLTAVGLQSDERQRVIGRVSSLSALPPLSRPLEDDLPLSPLDDLATPMNHLSLNPKGVHLTVVSTNANSSINGSAGPSPLGILNANHFVDAELLHGVSIDFTQPVISAKLSPMQSPMPTLISLPYGRCPPLHFQASCWRHLLKLMARLSGTKMEPSIEAMAVAKNETLKLRTVVQFLKPHHMSQEWRTILWFTIDHPVPSGIPNANKFHPTNVNTLPFSYTLSNIPAMLRDASDTVVSKTYTIPATAAVPFPSLPITFPNLALYLQAALDYSRQQSESNPMRKLAKMVQTCYPNDLTASISDEPEKSGGVSGLFKKVMGRGGKKGKKGAGGGNEDTYDLVTPFVPDEWG